MYYKQNFLCDNEFNPKLAEQAFISLVKYKESNLLNLPFFNEDLEEIDSLSVHIRENFDSLVVFAIGGASLASHVFTSVSDFKIEHNPSKLENIEKTAFLIISKSGESIETIRQAQELISNSRTTPEQIFTITGNMQNPLYELVKSYGGRIIEHYDIGGRFSNLSNAGLLPAAIAGLDIRKIRQGAKSVLENPRPVIEGASFLYHLSNQYIIAVLMPYIDRLDIFANWYVQLISETLGKDEINFTPLKASGPFDHHGQAQSFLGGYKNKSFTLINLSSDATSSIMLDALKKYNCPTREIQIDRLDEYSVGALIMHFSLEAIILAKLFKTDPFSQDIIDGFKKELISQIEA